ncbi:MAG: PIG-L family deacetylase [Lachnospiraceae bacterium]|nr:PIG-L family deacetylase [Lachnospiraceae bacterium]
MNVLVFAPHPDDEILGCGGTMARHIKDGDEVSVCIVTSGKPPVYDDSEAVKNGWPHALYPEVKKSHELLGIKETVFLQLPCVLLEQQPRHEVNAKIAEVVTRLRPDVVYIPHFGDMQKDHQAVVDAVMVAVRPKGAHRVKTVYAYETLSETEWNVPHAGKTFIPNTFVNIEDFLEKKIEAMECYQSQLGDFPSPRSVDALRALAMLRGSTMGAKAAEAFALVREYR